jgi:hypothetical protein
METLRRAPAGSVVHAFDLSPVLIEFARPGYERVRSHLDRSPPGVLTRQPTLRRSVPALCAKSLLRNADFNERDSFYSERWHRRDCLEL